MAQLLDYLVNKLIDELVNNELDYRPQAPAKHAEYAPEPIEGFSCPRQYEANIGFDAKTRPLISHLAMANNL